MADGAILLLLRIIKKVLLNIFESTIKRYIFKEEKRFFKKKYYIFTSARVFQDTTNKLLQ